MESKKINQLATNVAPVSTDLTIIGDPITGVSKKITLLQLASIFSGSIAFYTNYAAFPATGTVNTIYCAKDTNKLYLWSGSAYVETFPSQALLDTYQLRSEKGVSNGYASLDSAGKVPISQLPSSIMEYKGMWSATTNTPTLANGTGDTGDVYICNGAGSVNFGAGAITFAVGDYVVYSGTIWQRSSGAVGTVTSVGLSTNGNSITIGSSPISTSGTITANFAGTSLQYINGAGNLVTFPTLLSSDNLVAVVRNQSGATMTAGTIVYISGATGNKPLISKALATGDSTSAQTYGFVQSDITNNADGYVVVIGNVNDLDTSALTEGQQLYLSGTTAGTYTTTKPYAPIHLVYVGIVLRSHPTQGIIGVKIQNGFEMDELHNVDAYLPNNNDILSYNTTTSLWEHKQIATTLGFTPISLASLSATSPIFYNSTTGVISSQAASATLEGYVTTGTQTIAGDKSFTGINSFDYGINYKTGASLANVSGYISQAYATSGTGAGSTLSLKISDGNSVKAINLDFVGSPATYTYTFPATSGTLALTSDLTSGTVTSVAALTLGTIGTDLSSTVANGTTTPVITLNVPTASATNRGALSSADWTTFNNKQAALTNPVTGTGTTNYLSKFTGTSTIGNSLIWDNGTNVGIGNTNTSYTLDVSGTGRFTSTLLVSGSATFNTSVNITKSQTDNTNTLVLSNSSTTGAVAAAGMSLQSYNGTSTVDVLTLSATGNSWSYQAYGANAGVVYAGGTGGLDLMAGNASGAIKFFTAGDGTGNQRMTITSAGNVGIGTSSPAAVLEVAGTSSTADFRISRTVSSSTYFYIKAPGGTPSTATMGVNGTDVMSLTSGGNVGIGNTGLSFIRLRITGASNTSSDYSISCVNSVGTDTFYVRNDGLFVTGLATQSPYNLTIAASANCHIYSDGTLFRATSSIRYKSNIENFNVDTFGLINKIRPVWYRSLCERDKKDWSWYGFIAEELAEIDPRFVQFGYASEDYIKDEETNETKLKEGAELRADGVMYDRLTVLLIKGMQEQQIQIQNLQEQINILAK